MFVGIVFVTESDHRAVIAHEAVDCGARSEVTTISLSHK